MVKIDWFSQMEYTLSENRGESLAEKSFVMANTQRIWPHCHKIDPFSSLNWDKNCKTKREKEIKKKDRTKRMAAQKKRNEKRNFYGKSQEKKEIYNNVIEQTFIYVGAQ